MRVCFFLAADGNYFPYACLAARRIVDMSTPIPGFILHTGVSKDDMEVGRRLLGGRVEFVDAADFMKEKGFRFGAYSIAAYVRLFADLLPAFDDYDRIAYCDCDVLFNRDINDLACQELKAPLLAAHDDYMYLRPSYREELSMELGAPYFNSGVIVLNMPLVREQRLLERTRQVAIAGKMNDQNALNVAFEGKWQTMHPNWNLMSITRHCRFADVYARHFAGGKPWGNQLGVELQALRVWLDLAKDTPWGGPFRQQVPFERGKMRGLAQRFDRLVGLLPSKDRYRRRARYDGKKMHEIYAKQADALMLAVSFPEILGGFG